MPNLSSLDFGNLRPTFEGTLGAARPPNPPTIPEAEASRLVALVQRLQRALPLKRLGVLARVYESDDVLARLPLLCRARLLVEQQDAIEGGRKTLTEATTVVGSLATDHAGYASFDLRPLAETEALFALAARIPDAVAPETVVVTLSLSVLPFAETLFEVDALAEGDVSHDAVVLPLAIEQAWLEDRVPDLALPALQNPGLADWRLSPGSFALAPERLLGSGGCQDMLPSDLSTHQFRFVHLVRLIDKSMTPDNTRVVSQVRYGYQMVFENQWFPIGHSLGQVLYSLPLAPGETVNLAITDWTRTDSASRAEDTRFDEALEADSQRDRTITEVVRGVVSEEQEGSSVMGGISTNVLVPLGDVLLGGALGFGGSSSDTSGLRTVSTDMTQRLNDRFRQSSSAVRQLRSTVITQSAQAEQGRFETRSITNYNHCHTLTLMYYEVLRHYRIVTEQREARPVLLVTLNRATAPNPADKTQALAHRAALEGALLDRRHLTGFAALLEETAAEKRLADAAAKFNAGGGAADRSATQFTSFFALFRTGQKGTDSDIFLEIERTDGLRILCRQIDPPPANQNGDLDAAGVDDFESDSLTAFEVSADAGLSWGEIAGFVVRHQLRPQEAVAEADPTISADFSWDLAHLKVIGRTLAGKTELVLDRAVGLSLKSSETPVLSVADPVDQTAAVPPKLTDFIAPDRLAAGDALVKHLSAYKEYYRLALLFARDPVARASALNGVSIGPGVSLFDVIEPRPVGQIGEEIAFRLTDVGNRVMRQKLRFTDEERPLAVRVTNEELLSLPTRGVFAEGKIGHCSTCEVIDDTRFWDFQTSPLPNQAPEISAIDTSSRYQAPQGLAPTQFPNPIVNIVNPAPAPDPTATQAALKALSTADIFRDMSGQKELESFLTGLTKGNAEALTKFAELQQKQKEAEQKPALIDQIKDLEGFTPEQKEGFINRILGGGEAKGGGGDGGTRANPGPQPSTPDLGPQPKPPPATKRKDRKPARPAPPPVEGTRHILVDLEPKGVLDPSQVSVSLIVKPIGTEKVYRTDELNPSADFLRVEVPASDGPNGQIKMRMAWTVVRDYTDEARAQIRAQKWLDGDPDWADPLPVRSGLEVSITADVNYAFADGAQVINLVADPILVTTKIKTTSFASAELEISTQLGIKILPISTTLGLKGTTVDSVTRELQYEVIGMRELQLRQV